MSNQDIVNGPVQSLDTQIAVESNDVEASIRSHYGTQPNNLDVNATSIKSLSYRMPQNKLQMPSKVCTQSIDFLDTYNDLNVEKNIKSFSLDPIMKRLIQEKNNIMRDIEGWIASQANDGARQPILATTIVKWTQKAIGYMRCGVMIIKKITNLINDITNAITGLINAITSTIASNLLAIKRLQNQMHNLK